jgi:hypothetical protein
VKIIFLDFDGVLNSNQYLKSDRHPKGYGCGIGLDALAVARLYSIVRATGARIVVTSAWRTGKSLDHLSGLLQAAGCHLEVLDKTADLDTRGNEIRAWLEGAHFPISSLVMLDDDWIDGFESRQVKTEFETGLQAEHVEAAIKILNGETAQVSQ